MHAPKSELHQQSLDALAMAIRLVYLSSADRRTERPERGVEEFIRALVDLVARYIGETKKRELLASAALLQDDVCHLGLQVEMGVKGSPDPPEDMDVWVYGRLKGFLAMAGLPSTDDELAKLCNLIPDGKMADDEKREHLARLPYRIVDLIRAGSARDKGWITKSESLSGVAKPAAARDRLRPRSRGERPLSEVGHVDRVQHFLAALVEVSAGTVRNARSALASGGPGEASKLGDGSGSNASEARGAFKVPGDVLEAAGLMLPRAPRSELVRMLAEILGFDEASQRTVVDVLERAERTLPLESSIDGSALDRRDAGVSEGGDSPK